VRSISRVDSLFVDTVPSPLEGFENASRFRHETRYKNSPRKLATQEGNSQIGSDCPNFKAPENSHGPVPSFIIPRILD
jgi:hypothetical protein